MQEWPVSNPDGTGLVDLLADDPVVAGADTPPPWRILIVDDDADVHLATEFALQDAEIQGRGLQFLNAFSAAEAREIMARERDIAVVLLDVVMNSDSAGLQLVRVIRDELGIADTRIVLRTGQPGQAPEIEVIRDYDINDFKFKSELSRNKLYITLSTAIRSYEQIRELDDNRRGLEHIVRCSTLLMGAQSLDEFTRAVLAHVAGLIGQRVDGLICVRQTAAERGEEPIVQAASGRFEAWIGKPLSRLEDDRVRTQLDHLLAQPGSLFGDRLVALHLGCEARGGMVAYLSLARPLNRIERNLMEVFGNNIAMCASNLSLLNRLRNAAYVDALLGLPNRLAFLETVGQALQDARRDTHAVVLLDIDQFAELNDALGQRHGDLLLKAVGQRLGERLGTAAYLARIAGDTFGLLLPLDLAVPDRLLGIFRDFFDLQGVEQRVMVTAGVVALREVEGQRGSDALKDASIILKRAKRDQRGEVAYFRRAMVTEGREQLQLLQELRVALDQDQLFLIYQPQLDLSTDRVVGMECLLRWRNGAGQLIPPDRFIPLAEQSGLIVWLGEWVLRAAAAHLRQLRARGWGELRVAVNVSVVQLRQPDFIDMLKRVLHDYQVPPERLELEITESMAMGDFGANRRVLDEIRQLGVELALDDFGTGYSSLGYLQRLAVNRLKIDRSFVRNIETPEGVGIIRTVIQLGHTLGLTVLAEGVEKPAWAERLKELGCHETQGYLYSPPIAGDELLAWLERQGGEDARGA